MFYYKRQNNVHGVDVVNALLAKFVVVEADSLEEANKKGDELFEYDSCPCCGERWYKDDGWFEEDDAKEDLNNLPLCKSSYFSEDAPELRLHRKDGTIESYKILNSYKENVKLKRIN